MEEFPALITTKDQSSATKSFHTIDCEFESLDHPESTLSPSSTVYAASEVFRFLRDMALGVTAPQTKSLLSRKTLPAKSDRGPKRLTSGYLVHPGAVLCMLDLLPCVGENRSDERVSTPEEEEEEELGNLKMEDKPLSKAKQHAKEVRVHLTSC